MSKKTIQSGLIVRPVAALAASNPTTGIIIFDESGSMKQFGDAPTRALNQYLLELSIDPNAVNISAGIITFANEARVLESVRPVSEILPIKDYRPDGGTALYGTVAETLERIYEARSHGQLPGNVLVSVFTDGEDTVSNDYLEDLRKLVRRALEMSWIDLTIYGIGVDARELAKTMGFSTDSQHAITVPATVTGIQHTMSHASRRTILTATGFSVRTGDSAPPSSPH